MSIDHRAFQIIDGTPKAAELTPAEKLAVLRLESDEGADNVRRAVAFLDDRIREMDADARPADAAERADLERRLHAALTPADLRFSTADWFVLDESTWGAIDPENAPDAKSEGRAFSLKPRAEALGRVWPAVVRAWQLERAPGIAARLALDGDDADAARDPNALPVLTNAVADKLRDPVGVPTDAAGLEALLMRDRLTDAAKEVRRSTGWEVLANPAVGPLWVAKVLAAALWDDRVRRVIENRHAPSLTAPFITKFASVRRAKQMGLPFEGAEEPIEDKQGRIVGHMVPTIDDRVVSVDALRTLPANRLLRWLSAVGFRQRFIDEKPEFARIVTEGGWPTLAEMLGMRGKKAADEVEAAAYAWAALVIDWPTNRGHVFSVNHHRAAGQRRAKLEMVLLGPLRPGFVIDELAGHRIAEDKWLVPMPTPHALPPMVGGPRNHAAQATLQLLAMREVRTRAAELIETGAVTIDERRRRELADESELPARLIPDVFDTWATGNGTAPAFLTRPAPDRFDLAPAFDRERRAIIDAAERQLAGRRGGRKRQATARARVRRMLPRPK
jgi:hypothetical protein